MENKKNKNIIIILLVIILLAVIIFGIYYFKNNKIQKVQPKNNQEMVVGGGEKVSEVDVDNLVSELKTDYKQSKAFKECIAMDMGVKSCYRDAVNKKISETGDVNLCNDLTDVSERKDCVNNFYKNKAVADGNESLCDKTTDKEYCLSEVITKKAEKAGDEKVCDKIGDGYKSGCKQAVIRKKAIDTENPALCDKLVYTRVEGEGENKKEIKETMDADMCKEDVKMEIQMKKDEAIMKNETTLETTPEKTESETEENQI